MKGEFGDGKKAATGRPAIRLRAYGDNPRLHGMLIFRDGRGGGLQLEEALSLHREANALLLRCMLAEARSLAENRYLPRTFVSRLKRLVGYCQGLADAQSVLAKDLSDEDRRSITDANGPDSDFETAMVRYLELYCTRPSNLVVKETSDHEPLSVPCNLDRVYWRAGREPGKSGEDARRFEDKYLADLTILARRMRGRTIEERAMRMGCHNRLLKGLLRHFDDLFSRQFPAARGGESGPGGSATACIRLFPFAWQDVEEEIKLKSTLIG